MLAMMEGDTEMGLEVDRDWGPTVGKRKSEEDLANDLEDSKRNHSRSSKYKCGVCGQVRRHSECRRCFHCGVGVKTNPDQTVQVKRGHTCVAQRGDP
eukprot:949513-Rhodomonas_salina.1